MYMSSNDFHLLLLIYFGLPILATLLFCGIGAIAWHSDAIRAERKAFCRIWGFAIGFSTSVTCAILLAAYGPDNWWLWFAPAIIGGLVANLVARLLALRLRAE